MGKMPVQYRAEFRPNATAQRPRRPRALTRRTWRAWGAQSPRTRPKRCCGPAGNGTASGSVAWAPVDYKQCTGQYHVRGEGAGRQCDGDVVKQAWPSGVRWRQRGYGGRQRWRCCPAAQWTKGEANGSPKWKDTELWRCSPDREKTAMLWSKTN
jgi:hypothetical protein